MIKALFAAAVLFAPAASVAAPTPEEAAVRAVIEGSVEKVLAVLKEKETPSEEKRGRVQKIVEPIIDLPLMGKLALGPANWSKLSEPQRKEYSKLFVQAIQDSYFEKLELFTDETVEYDKPTPAAGGKYQMPIYIMSKGQRYKLVYKLYRKEGWKIYDLEIEGISIVRSYGNQYDQIMQKSGPDGLLARMKDKNFGDPEDLQAASNKNKENGKK
jgi:phospholipid transport system substrate-binding protein